MARRYLGDTVETDTGTVGTITFIYDGDIDVYEITDSDGVTRDFFGSELYTVGD